MGEYTTQAYNVAAYFVAGYLAAAIGAVIGAIITHLGGKHDSLHRMDDP